MKRIGLIFGVALTLCAGTQNLRAHGGCYGFWPFWPLALGAGIAIASAASAHSSPTYVYVPPAYPYGYAYTQPHYSTNPQPAQAPTDSAAAVVASYDSGSRWTPSYPGAGHWVPDPTPYAYNPGVQNKAIAKTIAPASQKVTITRSATDVPIYVVSR